MTKMNLSKKERKIYVKNYTDAYYYFKSNGYELVEFTKYRCSSDCGCGCGPSCYLYTPGYDITVYHVKGFKSAGEFHNFLCDKGLVKDDREYYRREKDRRRTGYYEGLYKKSLFK